MLWELECCAAQALVTLMNLSEGRPNHFGVFRACVYVEEMRMLEAKVLVTSLVCSTPFGLEDFLPLLPVCLAVCLFPL